MVNLKYYNSACAILHGLQGIGAIIYTVFNHNANEFRVPILTHHAKWNETTGPADATQELGLFPLAGVTCSLPFMSCLAHIIMACSEHFGQNNTYRKNINKYRNPWRWIEYAFSSTLMFFLICLLFSIYDLSTLMALAIMNASIMFLGYVMEKDHSVQPSKFGWKPFFVATGIALVQWGILYSTLSTTDDRMPDLIWAVLFSYFFLFLLFPANMAWLYWNWDLDKNNKYIKSERVYMLLSLTSKSILLWLILFGVNQPNVYTMKE
jgi:hypothetical protein